MFISEIADISVRGALGAFFQLFLTIGILIVYLVGAFTDYVTLSIVCGIVPVLLILFMFVVPESPTYLLKQVIWLQNWVYIKELISSICRIAVMTQQFL